jgi:hypothetical protein
METSGSEGPGSEVLENLTLHFQDGEAMEGATRGERSTLPERGQDAGEDDRSRRARSRLTREITGARVLGAPAPSPDLNSAEIEIVYFASSESKFCCD